MLLFILIAAYYIFVEVRLNLKNGNKSKKLKAEDSAHSITNSAKDDGFDFLRAKSKLESKGDKIIKGGSNNGE